MGATPTDGGNPGVRGPGAPDRGAGGDGTRPWFEHPDWRAVAGDYEAVGNQMLMISASGTAVRLA